MRSGVCGETRRGGGGVEEAWAVRRRVRRVRHASHGAHLHARPLKKTSAMKIARQKVLFMHAAPSSAASATVIVFFVFFAA